MTTNPTDQGTLGALCAQGLSLGKTDTEDALGELSMFGTYRIADYLEAMKTCSQEQCVPLDAVVEAIQLDEELSCFAFALLGPVEIALRSAFGQRAASFSELSEAYRSKTDAESALEIAQCFKAEPVVLEAWLPRLATLEEACVLRERLYARSFDGCAAVSEDPIINSAGFFRLLEFLFKLHDAVRPLEWGSIRWELRSIANRHPNASLRALGFPENWPDALDIPSRKPAGSPAQKPAPRARGRKGGRPAKSAEAIEKALFLYDMRTDSIQDISRKTGVATTTLYKYIHLREEKAKNGS